MPPQLPAPENLKQLPTEQLVAIILEQQRVIQQLTQAVNRLQASQHQDSQTSSQPPSTDLLKKPEKAKTLQQPDAAKEEPKRKPGGQPGHPGSTRKGHVRVERVANSASPSLSQLWKPGVGRKASSGASAASGTTGGASH